MASKVSDTAFKAMAAMVMCNRWMAGYCYGKGYTNLKNNAEVVASIERGDHLMLILKPFQSLSFGTGQGFSSSMGQTMK